MVLSKEEIWDRLKTESTWVLGTRTPLFAAVAERQFRYVVAIWISGDNASNRTIQFEKLEEDGSTYTMKFSPIPISSTGFQQIPEGGYSIEDPIMTFEGGTRLYGKTDVEGTSLNVTVNYWDADI
jgi:hypothetical protein